MQGVANGASGSVVNRRTGAFIMQESGRSFGGQGQTLDTQIRFPRIVGWLRSIRMEFPCAFYQLSARTNRRGPVFCVRRSIEFF